MDLKTIGPFLMKFSGNLLIKPVGDLANLGDDLINRFFKVSGILPAIKTLSTIIIVKKKFRLFICSDCTLLTDKAI